MLDFFEVGDGALDVLALHDEVLFLREQHFEVGCLLLRHEGEEGEGFFAGAGWVGGWG